jgi:hypothetical protein
MVILSISVCDSGRVMRVCSEVIWRRNHSLLRNNKITSLFCDQPSAVRDEAPDLKTNNVIMSCQVRAVSHLREMVIDKNGAMME